MADGFDELRISGFREGFEKAYSERLKKAGMKVSNEQCGLEAVRSLVEDNEFSADFSADSIRACFSDLPEDKVDAVIKEVESSEYEPFPLRTDGRKTSSL